MVSHQNITSDPCRGATSPLPRKFEVIFVKGGDSRMEAIAGILVMIILVVCAVPFVGPEVKIRQIGSQQRLIEVA